MKINEKIFIITVDTEGDNQWDNDREITTENSKYLPRFQELAEKYGFKPVWLTNYEMANDDYFVNYMKPKQENGLCEIGMHLHAWNNPPEYCLNKINREKDYLIEYPEKIIEEKIEILTNLITSKFGIRPISHRSGRWTTNKKYFDILEKKGYLIDCSVTPHVNWENCLGAIGTKGTDYSKSPEKPYYIKNNLLEVPMTIRRIHYAQFNGIKNIRNLLGKAKCFVLGTNQWMRPDKFMLKNELKKLIDKCSKKNEYIMFMIHSSELMPGGSPNFKTKESIERLYEIIEFVFKYSKNKGYEGMTLKEYGKQYKRRKDKNDNN